MSARELYVPKSAYKYRIGFVGALFGYLCADLGAFHRSIDQAPYAKK